MTKIDLQNIITNKLATLESIEEQQRAHELFNEIVTGKKTERPMFAETPVTKAKKEIIDLREEMRTLDAFADLDIDKILGVKPYSGNPYEAYSNKALDSALKIHDHKVRMSEMSTEAEIKDLESILRKYVKTSDERMDLEERIFDAKQALLSKNQAAVEKSIQDEEAALERRTKFSFNWIDTQKQTGTFTGEDEIAAYKRMIAYHKEYLAKINVDTKISQEERTRIQDQETTTIRDLESRIYDIRKSYAEQAVNEYIEAQRKKYDTEEALENERLNNKLKSLEKEYSDREREMKEEERETELKSLYEQERRFANAATQEGKDKLKDIREQIARLQNEGELDRLEQEKESRREAIEEDIEDNQKKYNQLREDLEVSQQEMLAAAMSYANEANKELTKGANDISTSLQGVMKQFDDNSTSLIQRGLEKLRTLVNEYKKLMDSLTMNPISTPSTATSAGKAASSQASVTVNVNDYGDKIINSKDETIDYTKELFATAQNAARTVGGTI